jgi:hypothetical protein
MNFARIPAGLLLDDRARNCGVCGAYGRLSKTHVPPQASGNTKSVERTDVMQGPDGIGPGSWRIGGMWVRGLCAECNNFAGAKYDQAYADFALGLRAWFTAGSRMKIPAAQSVSLAPGRVARSVLSGMLGISPHIRVLHPTLAAQMRFGGAVRLPGSISLRVAAYLGPDAQLTGPMLTGVVDGTGRATNTLAAITFHPLSWALVTSDSNNELARVGWVDATEWLLYEDDRTEHDLRWLAPQGLPVVRTILHAPSNDGIQLYSKEIAPIMVGRISN